MTDKFVSPEPPPSALESEILTILIEECGEVIQRATKMLRFGVNEVQPGQELSNKDRLSDEIGDLHEMLLKAHALGLTDGLRIIAASERKKAKLEKYLQNA